MLVISLPTSPSKQVIPFQAKDTTSMIHQVVEVPVQKQVHVPMVETVQKQVEVPQVRGE